jgi:nucleotide-binding universal stress UspA family protein
VTLLDEAGVDEGNIMRTPQGAIVVGVDGSVQALEAAEWAFQEAVLRQRPVHLVSGVILDLFEALLPPMDHAVLLDLAREALLDAKARAPQGFDLPVTRQLVGQAPARVLVEASEVADLVVVGTRGHGGFAGMLLGSVSQHVSRHAHCGVAVVRPTAETALADVVAGIDMSHRDPVVLRTAFEEARRRQVMLRVVHTWFALDVSGSPVGPGGSQVGVGPIGDHHREERARAQQAQLDGVLQPWRQDYPDVKVAHEAVLGHPVKVLTGASQRASLVVVGARGAGEFAGLLLGSTTSALLHRAHCPVLVAR